MKTLRCEGDGRVSLVEVPDPQPAPGEVLVRVEASAVCGSERSALMKGMDGNGGHEACGTIVDPGASGFAAGDRVGLAAVIGCGECDRCAAGQDVHCRRGPGVGGSSGGWHSELAVVKPSALRAVPDGLDAGVGALLTGDALGVPARGIRRVPSKPGDDVVVIGLGPVGLGHVLVRSFAGATVTAIEPSAYRRELALKLGAATVLTPDDEIGIRPPVVIECSGRPDCIVQALEVVENDGVVLQSGECHVDVPINPSEMFIRREITYTGSWYYCREDYPSMRQMLDDGLDLKSMCTHQVSATDAQPVITDFLGGNTGKVVLRWD